jgi:integrase
MADYDFISGINGSIGTFIAQKRASGYPYDSSARILHHLDLLIAERFPQAATLTKEICDVWLDMKRGEHPNGLLRRVTPVRQLAKYMNGCGLEAYVIPGHIPNKQIKYEAHIYTEEELKAFFASVDGCPRSPYSPTRCYVIPVIFRLLYCCGLRPSEARLLLTKDVDLETGRILIRESKGWKARHVYMADDLLEVCREYHLRIEALLPAREVFFPNKDGRVFNKSVVNVWFHEFWDHLSEAKKARGNPARPHDFRHVYAVNRLNRWVYENQDLNALYPYLSQYMGHANYADTDYYLALVESFYPEMESRLAVINNEILPEVCHADE